MKLKRSEKGARIARFIGNHAGWIGLRWDNATSTLNAPFPHAIRVVTERSTVNFMIACRHLPEKGLPVVIRYDGDIESVDRAIVGMTLHTYATLVAGYEEGRQNDSPTHDR